MHIFTGNSYLILRRSERTIRTLVNIHFAMQLESNWFSMNDREAVQSFCLWMLKCYTNVTIINLFCVSDYYLYFIMMFCPIGHHLCMALPFTLSSNVGVWGMWTCSLFLSFRFDLQCFWCFIMSNSKTSHSYTITNDRLKLTCRTFFNLLIQFWIFLCVNRVSSIFSHSLEKLSILKSHKIAAY